MPSPYEVPTIEALIEALDPEARAAIDDVDRTLIDRRSRSNPTFRQTTSRPRRAQRACACSPASTGASAPPLPAPTASSSRA
jgi:hypothetical protein